MGRILYSWFNKTLNKSFNFEEKELLNNQRMNNNECINVINHTNYSKKRIKKKIK